MCIKTQVCTDEHKKKDLFTKRNAASPTILTKAVMTTSVLKAKEVRVVVTIDITPIAYFGTPIEAKVTMVLEGGIAELIVKNTTNIPTIP
eukprot:3490681-Ditylum_brightwellii.AAC.1